MELTVWHPADGVLVVKWGLQCRPRKMTEGGLSCAEPRDDVSTWLSGSVPGPEQGLSVMIAVAVVFVVILLWFNDFNSFPC